MMETPDYLVIGGGIIGCTLARELARVSRKVVVLDRGRAGAQASSAAAGLLSATLSAAPVGPLADLCFESAALYESWVSELQADGAGDVGFARSGLLEVAEASQSPEALAVSTGELARPGRRAEVLSAEELRRREPALAVSDRVALFYPDDAQVDAAALSRAVAGVAERAGVALRENETVHKIVRSADRITAVHTATTVYQAGTVILAAGAWSGAVAEGLALQLPTRPVKGQLLLADCRVAPVRTPLHAGEALIAPRPDGTLLLGVTLEEAGFDDRVTCGALREILDRTCALVPAVKEVALKRTWAGLRPATPDGWPYMGPVPPLRNLWVTTGHFRKGILLAPLCARLMAKSILADQLEEDLEPFKPTRRIDH
jgi:glycine oxidase